MKITIELDSVSELLDVSRILAKLKSSCDVDAKEMAELGISLRAQNCLRGASITSIEDLKAMSDNDLLKLPNFGRHDLSNVRAALAKIGGAV